MGLGGTRTSVVLADDDELEWVDLALVSAHAPAARRARTTRTASAPRGRSAAGSRPADVAGPTSPPPAPGALGPAMILWLRRHPLWVRGTGPRILLVDLDNLRAGPARWQARMEVVAWLARIADHTVLAGQHGAVARAQPHLGALGEQAHAVDDGSDLADHVLLDAADAIVAAAARTVVISNDGIFIRLAGRGPLTVVSPGVDALSDKLRDAASRVVDLTAVEESALMALSIVADLSDDQPG
ncbi:MAG: hypothetical protein ABIV05_05185 [Actinomycetota bacterium]